MQHEINTSAPIEPPQSRSIACEGGAESAAIGKAAHLAFCRELLDAFEQGAAMSLQLYFFTGKKYRGCAGAAILKPCTLPCIRSMV